MSDLQAVAVARANGTELSLRELLHTLKLQGRLWPLVAEALADKVIATAARQEGLRVRAEELQRAADAFRLRHGLSKAADTRRWLAANRLSQADLEEGLQRALLRDKLAERVTAGRVEKWFAENRGRFDRARLRHLVVDGEGVAQELLQRVQEDGADFADLARRYSLDAASRAAGGSLGVVLRQRLAADVAAAVFAAGKGAVVGPFQTAAGHVLVQVEEVLLGQLDGATAAAIRQELFRDWLARQIQNGQVEVKLEV